MAKFKGGDKVKLPILKSGQRLDEQYLSEIVDYTYNYFLIDDDFFTDPYNIGIKRADGKRLINNSFHETDLELYEEKKIIGYKLKEEFKHLEDAAAIIGKKGNLSKFTDNIVYIQKKYFLLEDFTKTINNLNQAGVLDLWFEPVYELEKVKEKILSVGNPLKDIVISSDGKVTFQGQDFPIEDIKKLKEQFGKIGEVGKYATYPNSIWIGCIAGGTAVKNSDVNIVIDTYNELNKQ